MATINVSLPKEFADFVETQVASGAYASASEVVRDGLRLLRREQAVQEASRQFGPLRRRRYAALITRAIEMAAEQPDRPGSRSHDDLAAALCSVHIEIAARGRGAAVHVIYSARATGRRRRRDRRRPCAA